MKELPLKTTDPRLATVSLSGSLVPLTLFASLGIDLSINRAGARWTDHFCSGPE
ncbi:hypothetical protein BJY01DRAFT_219779 [Aspergillus pseudoustus]|uniref:Uncharacterized protein n=1 Tax=Aspergillus pseudoustus TaxID=1810923 RepID=A0ABR4JFM1_9EURO